MSKIDDTANMIVSTLTNTYSSLMDNIFAAKKSKKARSTDKPSFVDRSMIDKSKTAQQNATRILNNKYGNNNWNKRPGSEHNKIVKWIVRGGILKSYVGFFMDERNSINIFDYEIYRRLYK